jgi:hypothetical protein
VSVLYLNLVHAGNVNTDAGQVYANDPSNQVPAQLLAEVFGARPVCFEHVQIVEEAVECQVELEAEQ